MEDEAGITMERKSCSNEEVFSEGETLEKLNFFEKSFKDAEKLNLELKKDLNEKRQEASSLSLRLQELQASFDTCSVNEKKLSERVTLLEPLTNELKILKEEKELLERNQHDFDMQLELSLDKKEKIIEDLKKCLESSYDEIAILENGSKEEIKTRYKKYEGLQTKIAELENLVKAKDEAHKGLQKEFTEFKAEHKKLTEPVVNEFTEELENLKKNLADKESIIANLELSNSSLLENIDELSRNFEEASQKNTDILVNSNELSTINSELQEEIKQLKAEVLTASSEKDKIEVALSEANVELDFLKSQDFESLAISAQETVNQLQKKNEELVANHSTLMENVSNLKTQLHEVSTQKKCFEATVSDLNEEICSIKKISAEQEIGINSSKEALANVNLEKEALVATLEGVRKENEELKISNDQIRKAINDVRDENEKLLSSMNEMKIATESINFDFEQKETMWREQIEKLVKEKTAFEEEISSLKENNKENLLEDKVEKLSQEKVSYEEEITKLKKIIKESNEEPTKNEEIDVHVELQQEIERLKSELIFVNEEKRKLEETYQTEDKKSMLEKLSATLSCIEVKLDDC